MLPTRAAALGLSRAGWHHVASIERVPAAATTLCAAGSWDDRDGCPWQRLVVPPAPQPRRPSHAAPDDAEALTNAAPGHLGPLCLPAAGPERQQRVGTQRPETDAFSPQHRTIDKGHGRLETREIWTSPELNDYLDFAHVGQVFCIWRTTTDLDGKELKGRKSTVEPCVSRLESAELAGLEGLLPGVFVAPTVNDDLGLGDSRQVQVKGWWQGHAAV